mgnify:CR=1 FL=1
MKAKIIVMPRRDVLDPQGEAVKASLITLGYDEVAGVRVGRFIEMEVHGSPGEARTRVKAMCDELLANEVIEDYSFTLDADGILSVTAKETRTGKSTSTKIQASSGLSRQEVEQLSRG